MPDDHIREPPTTRSDSAFFEPCQPGTARSAPNGTRHAPCVRRDTLSRRRAGGLPRPMTDQHAMLGAETSGADGHDRPKVMVVEDDPDIRKILELFLTEKAFRVKSAESASQALEMLAEEPIDLILSDVRMPNMSGLDLLRHLKERDPEIQLVLMSAYSSVKDAVEAIRLGAAGSWSSATARRSHRRSSRASSSVTRAAPSRVPTAIARASSRPRTAGRFSSTKSASCPSESRSSCCGCWRTARSSGSAPPIRSASTCAWSRRPTATSPRWYKPAPSGMTSTTG